MWNFIYAAILCFTLKLHHDLNLQIFNIIIISSMLMLVYHHETNVSIILFSVLL